MILEPEVQDEIESLQAIYSNDFESLSTEDKRTFSIKIWPISCKPEEVYAHISIVFIIDQDYPRDIPDMDFKNIKGLSAGDVAELSSILKGVANANRGSVMIYEITMKAQQYVASKNRKPQTLEQEMRSRKIREEELMRHIREESSDNVVISYGDEGANTSMVAKDSRENYGKSSHLLQSNAGRSRLMRDMMMKVSGKVKTVESNQIDSDYAESDDSATSEQQMHSLEDNGIKENISSFPSRYQREFQEISRLGRGAFGEVWKVRNRLDRRVYAIKKIALDSTHDFINRKIRREVTTISRLLHKHVVRYYAAWIEVKPGVRKSASSPKPLKHSSSADSEDSSESQENLSDIDSSGDSEDEDEDGDVNAISNNANTFGRQACGSPPGPLPLLTFGDFKACELEAPSTISNLTRALASPHPRLSQLHGPTQERSTSKSVEHIEDIEAEDEGGEMIDLNDPMPAHWQKALPRSTRAYESNESLDISFSFQESSHALHLREPEDGTQRVEGNTRGGRSALRQQRYLYIQMEYCQTTLRALIDLGELWSSSSHVYSLLRQILEALDYIHGKGVIHRDLKVAPLR